MQRNTNLAIQVITLNTRRERAMIGLLRKELYLNQWRIELWMKVCHLWSSLWRLKRNSFIIKQRDSSWTLFHSLCDINMNMGESFQDYSWIQDFEDDFPHKVILKMLNSGDYISFSDLFSGCLRTTDHLILKLWIFSGHTASFKIEISKVQDFGNFELSTMYPSLWRLKRNSFIIKQRDSSWTLFHSLYDILERNGSVVECLIRDRRATGLSLTGITGLCPLARLINPSLVLVQPRKTRPNVTERLLTGT